MMTIKTLAGAAALSLASLAAQAAGDHGHAHEHKPASTAGALAKLTLLSGADKSELALSPAGDNKLEAKGSFKTGPGTKVVATVTLAGKKPVNVRFSLK